VKEEVKKGFFDMLSTKRQSRKSAKVHRVFAKFSVELLQAVEQKAFYDAHDMLH